MDFQDSSSNAFLGLSWTEATKSLHAVIQEELKKYKVDHSQIVHRSFGHNLCSTSICWAYVGYLTVGILILFFSPAFRIEVANDENIVLCGFLLLAIVIVAVGISIYTNYLKESEMHRKMRKILVEIESLIEENVQSLISPNLYAPPSENIALQWTYRNGEIVHLPWILLVENDIILLRPGREASARCRRLKTNNNAASSPDTSEFEIGQIYVPDGFHRSANGAVEPAEPLLCIVTEPAVLRYLRTCFDAAERPASLLENEYKRIVHFYMERFVVPACMAFSVFVAAVCYVFAENTFGSWYEVLILRPFFVVLPILSPVVPIITFLFYVFNTSVLLENFNSPLDPTAALSTAEIADSSLHLFTDETAAGSLSSDKKLQRRFSHLWNSYKSVAWAMLDLASGNPSCLPFSANIVFTLGNLTSLSVVDKKGILSWSNPSAEKVFFFSPVRENRARRLVREQSASTCSLYSSPNNNTNQLNDRATDATSSTTADARKRLIASTTDLTTPAVAIAAGESVSFQLRRKALKKAATSSMKVNSEVLDLTHDPNHEFLVHFDDSNWSNFLSNLKPIGLNVLLNGCALQPEYARFMDHVFAVSHVVPRTIAVVNRRCLCYLAKAVGFRSEAVQQFEPEGVIAAYKRVPGEIPLPGLTKHKTPLPNIFCTVVKDKLSDHRQIMCQGTADLILDSCQFYWDGRSVKPLTLSHVKKINDFAYRHSMTSYCLALSYRPLSSGISETLSNFYIDWSIEQQRCWSSTASSLDSLTEADFRPPLAVSFDSLLNDDYLSSPLIATADNCLQHVLKGQIFLGVISLQYQAKLDVVRLVDNLDKACIRFVHYSKENELRSRVFAEKCGLEAGWNCHISLADEKHETPPAHSTGISNNSNSSRNSLLLKRTKYRSSLRESSFNKFSLPNEYQRLKSIDAARSSSLPKDLKLDFPVVHFKSTVDSPMGELPKVIFSDETSTCAESGCKTMDEVFDEDDEEPRADSLPGTATERTPMLSETTSRTSLVTNHSAGLSASAAFFMTNRAQLPKGVGNVRPHLRDVDNVPLLVPLFTDCSPEAIREMIEIMQENGEVVAVLGSTLNYRNAEIFCQSNASIGVEPTQPAVCLNEDSTHTSASTQANEDYSSVWLANLISSLPCSLSIDAGEQISLLNLIAVSRHLLMTTRTALVFYLSASLLLSCVQLINQMFLTPPFLTSGTLIYMLLVPLPLIAASLCAADRDDEAAVKFATPKNVGGSSSNVALKMFIFGYFAKFLPTALFCSIIYKITLLFLCPTSTTLQFCRTGDLPANQTLDASKFVGNVEKSALRIVQNIFVVFLLFYICEISMGYVHYKQKIFKRCPFTNTVWMATTSTLMACQILYVVVARYVEAAESHLDVGDIPWYAYCCLLVWISVVLVLNEVWKMYEIRIWLREQRRRRLLYQTKLGMNSPF